MLNTALWIKYSVTTALLINCILFKIFQERGEMGHTSEVSIWNMWFISSCPIFLLYMMPVIKNKKKMLAILFISKISGSCVPEGHLSSKLLFYWLLFYLWLLYQILIQFTLNAKCEMKIIPVLFISAFLYAVSVFFVPVPGILELHADLNLSK